MYIHAAAPPGHCMDKVVMPCNFQCPKRVKPLLDKEAAGYWCAYQKQAPLKGWGL
jgi:hypothetical protein